MHESSATSSQKTPQRERPSLRFMAHTTLVVVSIIALALFLWQ